MAGSSALGSPSDVQQGIGKTPSGPRARHLRWLTYALVVAIAAFLRLYDLGTQPLWLDEGYSWWDAQQTFSNLWSLVPQCDPHPPLYFVILKFWMDVFGDGATALRALSALVGIATTITVMAAGREISHKVGWLAGLMFALTPFQIEFGHEARPYALLCFGASLVAFGALRIARTVRSPAVGYASTAQAAPGFLAGLWAEARLGGAGYLALFLGSSIVMWTNNTSILILTALCGAFGILMLLDRGSRHLFKPFVLVMGIVVLLWLPYVPTMLEQARGVSSDFWIPKPEGWRFTNELRAVVSLSAYDAVWWAVATLVGGLILISRRVSWRFALLLGCLVVAPVALNYVISMTIKPIFIARALIGIAPAVAILMAASVMLMRNSALRRSAVTLLIAAHGIALFSWFENYQGKEPWDRIATQLTAQSSPSDHGEAMVLLAANELALPLGHALEGMHTVVAMQGAPANFPSPGMNARYPSGKCAPSVAGQDLTAIASALHGHRVVYFVTRHNNVYDPGNGIARFLTAQGMTQTTMTTYMPGYLEVHKFVDLGRPASSSHMALNKPRESAVH